MKSARKINARRRFLLPCILLSLLLLNTATASAIDWDSLTNGSSGGGQTVTTPTSQPAAVPMSQATPQANGQGVSGVKAPTYNAASITFPPDQTYPVYTGPGEAYVRANNGKAMVSTNGWIDVLGSDGAWVLIQYAKNDGAWRRGYISASALPAWASVPPIFKENRQVTLRVDCDLTDDPSMSRAPLVRHKAGANAVYLHDDGAWSYIEVWESGDRYRGYVLSGLTQ